MIRLIALFVVLIFVSCSTDRPKGQTEAEVLYKEALQLIDDGHYIQATEYLNQIKSQYPYSYYSTHADLLLADIFFKQENYIEASAAYILFKDFHPKHQQIPYVIWMIGESYFNQLPSTFDRDLTAANEAINYYQQLISKYPDSEHIKDAKEKIKKAQKMLQDKEQYIADFYFKTESFRAARFRYLDILNHFDDSSVREHAMIQIVASSIEIKDFAGCLKYVDEYQAKGNEIFKSKIISLAKNCKK